MKQLLKNLVKSNIYHLLAALCLFGIAIFLNKYVISTTSARLYTNRIEHSIRQKEKDFRQTASDTTLLRSLIDGSYSEQTMLKLLEKNKGYGFFLLEKTGYGEPRIIYWNTQIASPPVDLMGESDVSRFVLLKNGYYVYTSKIVSINNRQYVAEALIPVMWKYFVQIENLKREFVDYPDADKRVELSFTPTAYPVKSSFGNTLFYLQKITLHDQQSSVWSIALVLVGVFLLFWFIHHNAQRITVKWGIWYGFAFLVVTIVMLRLATYYFPHLLELRQFELFDPSIYGSSFVLSSLGDLFINAVLLCWIALFLNRRMGDYPFEGFRQPYKNWLLLIVLLGIEVAMTLTFGRILQSLVADAQISFNVTNFFSLSVYSFIGFVILAILALAYFLLSQTFLMLVGKLARGRNYLIYIISATIGLLILTFTKNTSGVELSLYVLGWMLLFLWMMQQRIFSGINLRLNISEVLFWLFVFSFSIATVIIFENRKIEFEQRKRFAEKLALQADPTNERILSIALAYLDTDFLRRNFSRFKDHKTNLYLRDSIINKNFTAYLNKYDTKLYIFEGASNPTPLFNEDPVSFDTLNTIFGIQGKPTKLQDLRYFERSFDRVSYISMKEIRDSLQTIGYFFVLSEPKKYKGDALIPELFKETKELLPDYSPMYAYAIYNNLELIEYYNEYAFPTTIDPRDVPKEEFKRTKNNSYEVLWYKHSDSKIVMIAKKDNSFIEAITLFAYLFSTFLFLLAIYRVLVIIIRSRLQWTRMRQYLQPSIRGQIHSTIIVVSLLSFIIIGVTTILFFINRYDRNNREKIGRTIQILVNDLQNKIENHEVFNDGLPLFEEGVNGDVEKLMLEMSKIHGTDVNLYDPQGTLKVSSNPLIFSRGVLSEKMNPEAFYYLHNKHAIQSVTQEQMAKVKYASVYSPVRDDAGIVYAYLNVPSYTTQGELTQEISNFLVTIINLNAFIILVAGAIALFITNRITSTFTLIGQKMRDINLSTDNQEIAWNRNDEIGELVKEYNKMVLKLDKSAEALAKSEREGAWRQMARQVAHEIKNPLTPMKLSIQYLQKAINTNSPNVKEMTTNVARTLVEQIDHLSKIASDFSQFANIGNPRNEVFDLHELLYSLTSLYVATENLDFKWNPVPQRVMVFADKTQLNRLFTNLMQNAVEAAASKTTRFITIDEELNGEYITISIADNGEGIAEHTQSKIFAPNFTTKTSGTGLGLAMSKSIVENANGQIWFETEEGEGSTFFVKLPLLRATN